MSPQQWLLNFAGTEGLIVRGRQVENVMQADLMWNVINSIFSLDTKMGDNVNSIWFGGQLDVVYQGLKCERKSINEHDECGLINLSPLDKMAAISQAIFSDAFSSMKNFV